MEYGRQSNIFRFKAGNNNINDKYGVDPFWTRVLLLIKEYHFVFFFSSKRLFIVCNNIINSTNFNSPKVIQQPFVIFKQILVTFILNLKLGVSC